MKQTNKPSPTLSVSLSRPPSSECCPLHGRDSNPPAHTRCDTWHARIQTYTHAHTLKCTHTRTYRPTHAPARVHTHAHTHTHTHRIRLHKHTKGNDVKATQLDNWTDPQPPHTTIHRYSSSSNHIISYKISTIHQREKVVYSTHEMWNEAPVWCTVVSCVACCVT